MRELQPCGTNAAYNRHRYHGEETCPPCRRASADYERWRKYGRPQDGPPAPRRRAWTAQQRAANRDNILAAIAARIANAAGRCEDYQWLRDEQGLTREQAAERLGVTMRTAWRYEARIRQQVAA